jgi:Skp family chaperone for outer membrane proteins
MMRITLFALLMMFAFTACEEQTKKEEAKEKTEEAAEATKDAVKEEAEKVKSSVQDELNKIEADIQELNEKLAEAKGDSKAAIEKRIEILKQKHQELKNAASE